MKWLNFYLSISLQNLLFFISLLVNLVFNENKTELFVTME